MRFINPKIDLVFKRIFGSEHSDGISHDFLDATRCCTTVKVRSRIWKSSTRGRRPKSGECKDSYLDVRARLRDGSQVIIEMQALNIEGFEKRILDNAAKVHSTQLGSGDSYTLLNPMIALTNHPRRTMAVFRPACSRSERGA